MRARSLRLPVVVLLLVATGCFASSSGSSPRRYVDEVFEGTAVQHDLVYGSAFDEHGVVETLTLDLYEPAGDSASGRATVVWVHGGALVGGDKTEAGGSEAGFNPQYASGLARRGYVVAAVNYRLRESADFDFHDLSDPELVAAVADAQHDVQAAVRWLRAGASAYRIDPGRIAVAGMSAGGIAAIMAGYDAEDPGESGTPGVASDVAAAVAIAGCASDLAVIGAGEPPALLVHGKADGVVPYECAVATRKTAKSAGDRARIEAEPGGHMVVFSVDHNLEVIAPFLRRHVVKA